MPAVNNVVEAAVDFSSVNQSGQSDKTDRAERTQRGSEKEKAQAAQGDTERDAKARKSGGEAPSGGRQGRAINRKG